MLKISILIDGKKLNNIISTKMFECVDSKRQNDKCRSICSYWEHTWAADVQLPKTALNCSVCNGQWCQGWNGLDEAFNSNERLLSKESLLNKEYCFIDCLSPWLNFCCINLWLLMNHIFYDGRNMGNTEFSVLHSF